MKDWFVIKDIEEFANKARVVVYSNFGTWNTESELDELIDNVPQEEQDDLDKVLSQQESLMIIKGIARKQTNKTTQETRYIINDKLFADIIQDLNARMVSNILSSLVSKGLVETSYDTESNDFVFWVKGDENKDNPETD